MRISFVGKGGSGKSTLAASFASYLSHNTDAPVLVFDADLNIHTPELLGVGSIPYEHHLSHPEATKRIQLWCIGDNDIPNLGAFRKTTPPTRKSNILRVEEFSATPLFDLAAHKSNLSVFAVGTYQEDGIGASCYHNNLAILENIMSHTDDAEGYVVADMVAGVDAFAGTLHAQFDMTCLVVEPTKRSVEVYEKYKTLAAEAGVLDSLMVVGNKVRSADDMAFIAAHVEVDRILGYFYEDEHVREIDRSGGAIVIDNLNEVNRTLLTDIACALQAKPDARNERLEHLWKLHHNYVSQAFVSERFGDLTSQIDREFSYRQLDS